MALTKQEVLDQLRLDIRSARRKAIIDPEWFAKQILNLRALPGEPTLEEDPDRSWELDQWTINLLDAVDDVVRKQKGIPTRINHKGKNQISVRSMRGPGKTFGLACLMHWFAFCFKAKIPCVAPKKGQLKTRLWPEFRKIRDRSMSSYRSLMNVDNEQIKWLDPDGRFKNGPFALMETASCEENLSGLHYDYMLVLVDEASGVDEQFWPALEAATSSGVILILVIISNPTRLQGTFADSHLKSSVMDDWFQMHIRLEDTKRVKRDWVAKMERKYGTTSPVVQIGCYGEFAAEDENQLISVDWIHEARGKEFNEDGSIPRQRISVDVADGGENFTVLTHGAHYDSFLHLTTQTQHSFPAGAAQRMCTDAVEAMWKQRAMNADNGDTIVVDSVGVGTGVAERLIELGYPVIRYRGGGKSDNRELYRDRRVQSFLVLRDYYRDGKIVMDEDFVELTDWDDVIAQICSIRRVSNRDRVEDLMTKAAMTRKG